MEAVCQIEIYLIFKVMEIKAAQYQRLHAAAQTNTYTPRQEEKIDTAEKVASVVSFTTDKHKKSGWVACRQRLPQNHLQVEILFNGRFSERAYLDFDYHWKSPKGYFLLKNQISHWRPIQR